MNFDSNFRSHADYLRIIQELIGTTIYKHRLTATDVCVISTVLGLLGTEPIRKNTVLPETGEALIQESMSRGKEIFKKLAAAIAVLGPSRRHPHQRGLYNH